MIWVSRGNLDSKHILELFESVVRFINCHTSFSVAKFLMTRRRRSNIVAGAAVVALYLDQLTPVIQTSTSFGFLGFLIPF